MHRVHEGVAALAAAGALISACSLGSLDGFSGGGATDADIATNDGDGGPLVSDPRCPQGRGPAMVLVEGDGVRFCIDATEVTRAQYQAFLDAVDGKPQAPSCKWNTTFLPDTPVDMAQRNQPMAKVDWCDAFAFCAWAGKRLCGALRDGSALSIAAAADHTASEWMFACSRNGTRTYPYGATADGTACNDARSNLGRSAAVATFPRCEGGFTGVFDITGNVSEWENACEGLTETGGGRCQTRGGSYKSTNDLRCGYTSADFVKVQSDDWGIRCCATPRL